MNYSALEKNITDTIQESITKLGFEAVPITLYFPLEALCGILEEDIPDPMMPTVLEMFAARVKNTMGAIRVARSVDERYAITIPAEGVRYVFENTAPAQFTESLARLLEDPDCDIMEIASLFRANGDTVMKRSNCEDFDYVLYFRGGDPDDYRYCFHEEMGRMIYHRFAPAEFEKMFGQM